MISIEFGSDGARDKLKFRPDSLEIEGVSLEVKAAGFGAREGNIWAQEVVGLGSARQSRTRCCRAKEKKKRGGRS